MAQKCYDWALVFLRLAVGIVFTAHGCQKLFTFGISGVTGFLQGMGLPLPGLFAWIISLTEFGGGLLLLFGLFTRVAALFIAIAMAVAIMQVHLPNGFFLPQGMEQALSLFLSAIALILAGAGKLSLDAMVFKKKQPTTT